ncbi:hypothetical protein O7622_27190 [Micromonospora sp. WMMD1076]|uniref:hypothetical protein n=1 Tax=Micromonospora sp. WMMD1076 TaxID=3016103 RepID=UPI00249B8ADF|nr:hypothetical protein [Micromonospora sp. WMMD1076]WFF06675.1 hypothetical protein O7622_27190 [Micromonospora sp. WMMD1076]
MSAEHEVIDLDEHDHRPADSDGTVPDRLVSRRTMNVRLVAALVIGVVLGGAGASELRVSRDERERNASVVLVALPEDSVSGDSGTEVLGVIQLDGQLAVINAGPAPITVGAAAGQRPGIQVRDTGQSKLLRPGGTGWIDVKVRIECSSSTAFESEPLSIRSSVETADRRIREVNYPVAVKGGAWDRAAEMPCAYLSYAGKRGG